VTISSGTDSFELADYLGPLRRRWRVVLVLTCLGVVAAGAYYKTAPRTYTATAAVYVNATAANNNAALGRTGGPVNMDNEAQIVQSQTVATLAAKRLRSSLPPQTLVKQISITVPANTTVLDINCKGRPRAAAAACANDFASAYLSVRLSGAAGTVSSALSALQSNAAALATRISQLKIQVSALPTNSARHTTRLIELTAADSQLTELENQINLLVPELSSLQAPGNTLAGHVITPAIPPATPSSPRALLLFPSGLLAGLLIGLIAAFFVDRRDDRINAARDVERFLDLPVLLSVSAKNARTRAALAAPRSRADREFAELAQHIAVALGDGNYVLLVAGTTGGSGGSVVAANLAAMLARTGSEVVLVCADDKMAAPRLLGVHDADGRGLAEVLAGTASLSEVMRKAPGTTRLQVITAGADTSVALSGVERDVIRRVVADLSLDARFVIIEASAVGDAAETFGLAEFADAAIVAIEESATRRSDVEDCLNRLDRLGTIAVGAAVIPASRGTGARRIQPRGEENFRRPMRQTVLNSRSAADRNREAPLLTRSTKAGRGDEEPVESDVTQPRRNPADSAAGA
jgi:capsular polysaccharide biosynthesis protein/Mrp family chromosome partitioning ATPase